MINIALKSGSVALAIAAEVKEEKQAEVFEAGLASICYRAGASKVFGAKGHSRDEAYSSELSADVHRAMTLALAEVCDKLDIKVSEYVAPESKAINVSALRKSLAELGMDEAAIDKVVAKSKRANVNLDRLEPRPEIAARIAAINDEESVG